VREQELRSGRHESDVDLAGQPLDGVAQFRCGVPHFQAHALRPFLQHLAGGRQANAAAGSLEQRPAADFFQAPKAAREGRLAPVQPQRRLADMLQVGVTAMVALGRARYPSKCCVRASPFDIGLSSDITRADRARRSADCITATGNVNPSAILQLYKTWPNADADEQQSRLVAQRAAFSQFPMFAPMKAAIALKTGRQEWRYVRPPLVELDADQQQKLAASLDSVGFVMPNASALSGPSILRQLRSSAQTARSAAAPPATESCCPGR